jgi:hypothetical protein
LALLYIATASEALLSTRPAADLLLLRGCYEAGRSGLTGSTCHNNNLQNTDGTA